MKISESAQDRILQLQSQHPDQRLRVSIRAGGCSGFEIVMSLDSLSQEDHDVMGLVAVDPMSWDLIANSELNYVTGIGRRAFDLIIPSSTANCGCGKSFQILSQH